MNALIFAALLLPAQAEMPSHFLVRVVDGATNQPIAAAGVEIRLKNSQDKAPMFVPEEAGGKTNSDGEAWFRVTGPVPNKLQIVAKANEYETAIIQSKWNPDSIPRVVLALTCVRPRQSQAIGFGNRYSTGRLSVVDTGKSIVYSASSWPSRYPPQPVFLPAPYGPIFGGGVSAPFICQPPDQLPLFQRYDNFQINPQPPFRPIR